MRLDRKTALTITMILCSAILFGVLLMHLGEVSAALRWIVGVLMPVLLGLCIAFILYPLAAFLERLLARPLKRRPKIARALSVAGTIAVLLAAATVLSFVIVPQVSDALGIIARVIPGFIAQVNGWFDALAARFELPLAEPVLNVADWESALASVLSYVRSGAAGDWLDGVMSIAASVVGGVFDLVMALVIAVYALLQREQICRFCTRLARAYLNPRAAERLIEVVGIANSSFRSFVVGQLNEAMILGALCFIGMLIFRFPYAVATSAVVMLTALVPIFGAWIGGTVGALLAFTVSPVKALLFVLFIVVLQQLEGNLIYPRVVGASMGLPGLLILTAVLVGGSVAGVMGMLLSVPLCSVAYTLLRQSVARRLEGKAPMQAP